MTTTTDIAEGDTVHLDGNRRRAYVVDFINRNSTVDVTWTRNVGRDIRITSCTVAADRLTLARKGNADQDMCDAMFADQDADHAYRDGTGTREAADTARANLLALLG